MLDELTAELVALAAEFEKRGIRTIVGGGMGLFLWERYLNRDRSPRYPLGLEARSTQDLDIFLTAEMIADHERIKHVKEALIALGYEVDPGGKFFKYKKPIRLGSSDSTIGLDILSAPPRTEDTHLVKLSDIRVRPKKVPQFHGRLVGEARHVGQGLIPVPIPDGHRKEGETVVYLPSAINYLTLKLHAFGDQVEDEDKRYGRHHAWDNSELLSEWERRTGLKRVDSSPITQPRALSFGLQRFARITSTRRHRLESSDFVRTKSIDVKDTSWTRTSESFSATCADCLRFRYVRQSQECRHALRHQPVDLAVGELGPSFKPGTSNQVR